MHIMAGRQADMHGMEFSVPIGYFWMSVIKMSSTSDARNRVVHVYIQAVIQDNPSIASKRP